MVNSALSRLQLVSHDLEGLEEVTLAIIDFSRGKTFWIFEGDMGAGKTTMIKSIGRLMGVQDTISSPTYSLVNEYVNDNKDILYHFDFYRLNSEEEALDIGIEEYFDSGNYCFVEWPSKVPSLLPVNQYLTISIEIGDSNQRIIEVTHHD